MESLKWRSKASSYVHLQKTRTINYVHKSSKSQSQIQRKYYFPILSSFVVLSSIPRVKHGKRVVKTAKLVECMGSSLWWLAFGLHSQIIETDSVKQSVRDEWALLLNI